MPDPKDKELNPQPTAEAAWFIKPVGSPPEINGPGSSGRKGAGLETEGTASEADTPPSMMAQLTKRLQAHPLERGLERQGLISRETQMTKEVTQKLDILLDLKMIILSEVSQTEKDKYPTISLICRI